MAPPGQARWWPEGPYPLVLAASHGPTGTSPVVARRTIVSSHGSAEIGGFVFDPKLLHLDLQALGGVVAEDVDHLDDHAVVARLGIGEGRGQGQLVVLARAVRLPLVVK